MMCALDERLLLQLYNNNNNKEFLLSADPGTSSQRFTIKYNLAIEVKVCTSVYQLSGSKRMQDEYSSNSFKDPQNIRGTSESLPWS